ncbi:hypothetical protein ACFWN2_01725 [Lentzea sp. NPDC058436]|uniref:hypothetical protein n=1 Tax=Lentzea sp. NPDC058436 TaxID=3346499 RepID=UPI0036475B21
MGAKGFFGATRAHRRTARLADLIGARQGEVIRERRYGGRGPQPSPSRAIVTVRKGPINDVFPGQLDAVVAAGYPLPTPVPHRCGPGAIFERTDDLPRVEVTAFPAGTEFVEGGGDVVPDGHTGIVVDIST